MNKQLLDIQGLNLGFATEHGFTPVVHDLNLTVERGEIVGLVGESGCGKSATSLAIMGLIPSPPGRITGGQIKFVGRDLLSLSPGELRDVRGRDIAMIFQEPMTSLDPAFRVGEQIAAVARRHLGMNRSQAWERAVEMLDLVGIPDAKRRSHDYPHVFSGGMRQRVMIAAALVCNPKLLIADEPTTALDVTIQAQVLDLLLDLRDQFDMGIILVTHDLAVVAETCDRVVVMYAGEPIESAPAATIFTQPGHPYTAGLLGCLPAEHVGQELAAIAGTVPPPQQQLDGCRFHPRCSYVDAQRCTNTPIELVSVGADHQVRCVRAAEIELEGIT